MRKIKWGVSILFAVVLVMLLCGTALADDVEDAWAKSGQKETGLIMFSEELRDENGEIIIEKPEERPVMVHGLKRPDGTVVYEAIYFKIYYVNQVIEFMEGGYWHAVSGKGIVTAPSTTYIRDLSGNVLYQTSERLLKANEFTYKEDAGLYVLGLYNVSFYLGECVVFDQNMNVIFENKDDDEFHYLGDGYFRTSEKYGYSVIKCSNGAAKKLPVSYKHIHYAGNGLFKVMNQQGYDGIVDENNNVIVPFNFEWIDEESVNGYYAVGRFTKKEQRDWYIEDGYTQLQSYLDAKYGVIDSSGNIVIPIEWDRLYLSVNNNGKAAVKLANWGGEYEKSGLSVGGVGAIYEKKFDYKTYELSDLPKVSFRDVSITAYYAKPVEWAVGEKITGGTSATTFSPNDTCTNAHILTFLWRANGSPEVAEENTFTDVRDNAYYCKAALWAKSLGLISGTTMSPNAPCTRASTVMLMWKAAGSPSVNNKTGFTDVPANADYATAVAWAVENKVTNGTGAGTFSPNGTCTRAEIVTFLYRAKDI